MNELQMQNIGGIDYHLKDQYARDIIATSENGLDSQSDLPVASRPYVIGEYLIDQNRLYYEVIDTISTGDVLVVGLNIKRTTVSSELNKLKANSAIAAIEIVAPIEDTLLSAREYQADDPLYWVNEHLSGLYEATMHIVVGDALVIGTNIKPAKKIANSVKDINDEISDMTGILGAKNLCPNNASTVTQSGVTYTVNADGSVKITGTATADNNIILGNVVLPKGTYKLTTGQTQEQGATQVLVALKASDDTVIGRSSDSVGGALGQFTLNSDTEVLFRLACVNGRTGVTTVYPMCRPVTIENDSYVPHVPTNRELDLQDKELSLQISNRIKELWVNPNPSYAMAAQQITLNEDLSNYRFYYVTFAMEYIDKWQSSIMVPCSSSAALHGFQFSINGTGNAGLMFYRVMTPAGGNKMNIGEGFFTQCNTAPAHYNGACVPKRIWGIK